MKLLFENETIMKLLYGLYTKNHMNCEFETTQYFLYEYSAFIEMFHSTLFCPCNMGFHIFMGFFSSELTACQRSSKRLDPLEARNTLKKITLCLSEEMCNIDHFENRVLLSWG